MRHVLNVEVKEKQGESQEKLIRRFLKKCKKAEIVREYVDKTSCYYTRSQKKRQKKLRARFIAEKLKEIE